jgi:hypothetical protein
VLVLLGVVRVLGMLVPAAIMLMHARLTPAELRLVLRILVLVPVKFALTPVAVALLLALVAAAPLLALVFLAAVVAVMPIPAWLMRSSTVPIVHAPDRLVLTMLVTVVHVPAGLIRIVLVRRGRLSWHRAAVPRHADLNTRMRMLPAAVRLPG